MSLYSNKRQPTVVFTVSALAWSLVAGAAVHAEPAAVTRPDAVWESIFQRSEGWTGGDAVYTIELPGEKIVWLFADTWIGNVADGRHESSSRLVNNSLARCARPKDGRPPAAHEIQFLWGPRSETKQPTAWIRPDVAAATGVDKDASNTWYWLADGAVARGPFGQARLVMFLWQITKNGQGVMGFRSAGGAMAIIDNPAEDWTKWQPRQKAIAHSIPNSATDGRRRPEIVWGSEVVVERDPAGQDRLLIFGYRQSRPGQTEMVLARAPAAAVEDMDRWEFRGREGWSARIDDLAALAGGLTTEYSVTPLEVAGALRWVLIHSEPFFGSRIMARISSSEFGPWSAPQPIYDVPDLLREKKHFAYAAKAHPELSRPGELLVTYVVNSLDFGESVANADIYRPRFIRVPHSLLQAISPP